MIGEQVRELLEAEMKASTEFSRRNFGLTAGEDFREMVEGIVKSGRVVALLTVNLMTTTMAGERFGDSVKNEAESQSEACEVIRKAILENLEAFKPQFEFLYWGVQIGRKMARAEAEALEKLESSR